MTFQFHLRQPPCDVSFLSLVDGEVLYNNKKGDGHAEAIKKATIQQVGWHPVQLPEEWFLSTSGKESTESVIRTLQCTIQYLHGLLETSEHRMAKSQKLARSFAEERDAAFEELVELRELLALQRKRALAKEADRPPRAAAAGAATGTSGLACTLCGNSYPTTHALQSHYAKRHKRTNSYAALAATSAAVQSSTSAAQRAMREEARCCDPARLAEGAEEAQSSAASRENLALRSELLDVRLTLAKLVEASREQQRALGPSSTVVCGALPGVGVFHSPALGPQSFLAPAERANTGGSPERRPPTFPSPRSTEEIKALQESLAAADRRLELLETVVATQAATISAGLASAGGNERRGSTTTAAQQHVQGSRPLSLSAGALDDAYLDMAISPMTQASPSTRHDAPTHTAAKPLPTTRATALSANADGAPPTSPDAATERQSNLPPQQPNQPHPQVTAVAPPNLLESQSLTADSSSPSSSSSMAYRASSLLAESAHVQPIAAPTTAPPPPVSEEGQVGVDPVPAHVEPPPAPPSSAQVPIALRPPRTALPTFEKTAVTHTGPPPGLTSNPPAKKQQKRVKADLGVADKAGGDAPALASPPYSQQSPTGGVTETDARRKKPTEGKGNRTKKWFGIFSKKRNATTETRATEVRSFPQGEQTAAVAAVAQGSSEGSAGQGKHKRRSRNESTGDRPAETPALTSTAAGIATTTSPEEVPDRYDVPEPSHTRQNSGDNNGDAPPASAPVSVPMKSIPALHLVTTDGAAQSPPTSRTHSTHASSEGMAVATPEAAATGAVVIPAVHVTVPGHEEDDVVNHSSSLLPSPADSPLDKDHLRPSGTSDYLDSFLIADAAGGARPSEADSGDRPPAGKRTPTSSSLQIVHVVPSNSAGAVTPIHPVTPTRGGSSQRTPSSSRRRPINKKRPTGPATEEDDTSYSYYSYYSTNDSSPPAASQTPERGHTSQRQDSPTPGTGRSTESCLVQAARKIQPPPFQLPSTSGVAASDRPPAPATVKSQALTIRKFTPFGKKKAKEAAQVNTAAKKVPPTKKKEEEEDEEPSSYSYYYSTSDEEDQNEYESGSTTGSTTGSLPTPTRNGSRTIPPPPLSTYRAPTTQAARNSPPDHNLAVSAIHEATVSAGSESGGHGPIVGTGKQLLKRLWGHKKKK